MLSLRLLFYSLTILILGLAVALRISWQEKDQILPKNQPAKLIATLKKEPRIYDGQQVLEVGDGRVYVDLYPRYKVGDRLKIEGEVDSEGRISGAKVERISVGNNFMSQLRLRIWEKISQLLPSREATLVSGTVLGVDTIEKEFRDQLIRTGTIHVVVVSGQNLMIVAGVFLSLVKLIGRRQSILLATGATFFYAALTGFEPPVVRATLMVLASTMAIVFGREVMPLWSLLLIALLIIFIWPQAIGEISFQLTFAATLGIMTLGQKLTKIFNFQFSIFNLIKNNAAIAVSAYIFTAPIIFYYFGRVSILSPIANIFVVEAISPVMALGFLIAILSLILMPLAQILAYIAYIPAFYFVKVVDIFARIPVGQIDLGKGNWGMVVGFYMLLGLLMFIWMRKSKSK
ncbi:hypothetical protein A2683_01560 [Candidatus Curtissbacteria bacterium RIFCSPHIGHO2_01_FULL_34_40]|nr:MAG: hypothetical protein A2683_01560 [Candidatus Curtissbacteria bacterium RIFCSPHIGHO2_01_FULL_34_40]